MPIRPIVQFPNEVLRRPAEPVTEITAEVLQLLDDMVETMYEAPGIGLAAPQVGVSQRVIVVDVGEEENSLLELINPEVVEASEVVPSEEGCLSIPSIRETISRNNRVRVKALNRNGQEVTIEGEGLLAFCLQHEIDHLDGVLFIDRLSKLKKTLLKSKLKRLGDRSEA